MLKRKRKEKKFYKSVIAFALTIAMVFTALPSQAFSFTASAEDGVIYVVKELEEYRTQSSKTYLKSDGSLEAIVSSQPLHYKKENSEKWLDIEHTLELVEVNGKEVYKNKSGPLSVTFPESIGENSAVTIENAGNKISVEFLDYKKSQGNVKDKVRQKSSKQKRKLMTASELAHEDLTLGASIVYNEVYTDANVKYDFNSSAVKESIILNKKPNKHAAYRYKINSDGLVAELNSDGSINFYKQSDVAKSDMVFHIPAPYMYDSNNVYSYDIKTELEQTTGGYILTYTPNTEWLRSKERAYPVVIDPTYYTGNSVRDSYTYSAQPDIYFGYEDQLKIGRETTENGKEYYDSYLYFSDFPTFPDDYASSDASYLTLYPKSYTGTWTELTVNDYNLEEQWYTHQNDNGDSSLRLTYNNAPADEGFIRDQTLISNNLVTGQPQNFVVTSTGNRWMIEPNMTYGVKLALERSDTEPDACLTYHSSRSTEGTAPYITINYTPIVPLERIEILNKPVDGLLEQGIFPEEVNLSVEFYPPNATNQEVYWEIIEQSCQEVVQIYGSGTNVALRSSNYGSATVRAYVPNTNISDSFEVLVYKTPMESISMTRPRYDTLVLGNTFTPQFTINPANATDAEFLLEHELEFTSSNESVAVIEDRTIRAVGCGTTIITAAIPSCNVSCSYQLKADVQRAEDIFIIGTPDDYHLGVNFTHQLSAVVMPETAVSKNVIFTSSDESIATVTSSGLVTGVSPGMVTITARPTDVDYVSDTFDFEIISTEVTFNKPNDDVLMVGTSWQLVTESHIKVDAGNSNIVTVGANGWITANAVGTVRLEVYNIANRAGFVSYYLTVAPSGMEIVGLPTTLNIGDEIQGVGLTFSENVEYDPSDIVWTMTEPILNITYDYVRGIKVEALATGTVTVTAYISSLKASASITVTVKRIPVTGVTIQNHYGLDDGNMYCGETASLIAEITPTTSTAYQKGEKVIWSCDNGKVVFAETTSHFRKTDLTAITPGIEKVYATSDGVTSSYFFIIIKNPSITINSKPENNTMYVGDAFTIEAVADPDYATLTFASENKNIADFDEGTSRLVAKSAGQTTISVILKLGKYTRTLSFTLTVGTPVSSVTINNKPTNNTLYVGDIHQLSATVLPSNADNKSVTWSSTNTSVATVNSSGRITAVGVGTTIITVRSTSDSSKYATCNILVNKLKLYQTENTLIHDKDGEIAEDLCVNDKSEVELLELTGIVPSVYTATEHRISWEYMCAVSFATDPLEDVILDMIDHFMDGSGTEYRNSILTAAAQNHETTQTYVNSAKQKINELIQLYNGDITCLIYDAQTRKNNLLTDYIESNTSWPEFSTTTDKLTGLTICVDSLWGHQIEVKSYNKSGNNYSGTLTFTLYDHFGLGENDISEFNLGAGFRSWYILQHSKTYNGIYKPFVTIMEFDVEFSGTIN